MCLRISEVSFHRKLWSLWVTLWITFITILWIFRLLQKTLSSPGYLRYIFFPVVLDLRHFAFHSWDYLECSSCHRSYRAEMWIYKMRSSAFLSSLPISSLAFRVTSFTEQWLVCCGLSVGSCTSYGDRIRTWTILYTWSKSWWEAGSHMFLLVLVRWESLHRHLKCHLDHTLKDLCELVYIGWFWITDDLLILQLWSVLSDK